MTEATATLEPITEVAPQARHWYAVWTRSHFEHLVGEQLVWRGFNVFLPRMSVWSSRGGVRHVIQVPMFAGYLFVNDDIDKQKYIELHKARGVVSILGERWDRLTPIADSEISALRQIVDARLPIAPHPFLAKGQRVRIISGPLKDVEGFFVENKLKKGLLVLSIELLQRSVAVQVDCTRVAPV
jgi:transcriptional antiterminator NusG